MRTPTRYKPHIKVADIPQWLENTYARMRAQFLVTPEGKRYYLVNGDRIPCKEFEKQYPVKLKPLRNQFGLPIDGRSNFY